jgi:hypothetical protein
MMMMWAPQTHSTLPDTPEFCGTGRELQEQLKQHDTAIANLQHQMQQKQQAADSVDRHVPRSLHEQLKQQINERALLRMQWDRHKQQCQHCQAPLLHEYQSTDLAA